MPIHNFAVYIAFIETTLFYIKFELDLEGNSSGRLS